MEEDRKGKIPLSLNIIAQTLELELDYADFRYDGNVFESENFMLRLKYLFLSKSRHNSPSL